MSEYKSHSKKVDLFSKFFRQKQRHDPGLFAAIKQMAMINDVLYPGSFVDIRPSMIFANVVYIDKMANAEKFFQHGLYRQYIADDHNIKFLALDYNSPKLPLKPESFDLLISLFAGLVYRNCGKYLRYGGYFVTDGSFGDFDWCLTEADLEFIAVFKQTNKGIISETSELSVYQELTKPIEREFLIRHNKSYKRKAVADYYLFRKKH